MFVYGCITVLSGILAMLLPETKGAKMPDTIQESEGVEMRLCCSNYKGEEERGDATEQ